MKIALVFSLQNVFSVKKPLQYQEEMAFGVSYISAYLKAHGHICRLLVLVRETTDSQVESFMKEFRPDLMCFSAVASEFSFLSGWAEKIKKLYPQVCLLAGGCHVTLNPESALQSSFDVLCIGEGEKPTLEIVEQLEKGVELKGIANLWIKKKGDVEKNKPRPFIDNLDELPFPDREMWQEWLLYKASRPAILLGRGCPFQCAYCSNHALSKITSGKYVRFRSPDNVIQELKEIVTNQNGVSEVYFEIETFGVNKVWAIELCEKLFAYNLQFKNKISFGVNLRVTPNAGFEPLFKAMRKANFSFINIGLESGSERVRCDVMQRNYSNQDIFDTVALARKYGLRVHFLNMIGLPGETEKDILKTIECNRVCQPDMWASHTIFFPYPGTEIHRLCQEMNVLPDKIDVQRERSRPVLNLTGLSKRKIKHYYEWFDYYVYKGYRPLHKLLARVFVHKLHSSYRLTRIYRLITEKGLLKKTKEYLKN